MQQTLRTLNQLAAALWPYLSRLFMAADTFTPGIAGSGTAGTFTIDATNTHGQYTRVGDRIYLNGRLNVTATSVAATGNLSLTGLPFTSGANSNNGNILGLLQISFTGINLQAGYANVDGVIVGSTTSVLLYETGDDVARTIVQGGELGTAFDLWFSGMYKVD